MNQRKLLIIISLLVGLFALILFFGVFAKDNGQTGNSNNLVSCLAEAGMVIYGSRTCPACTALANSFGGYEEIEEIYIECTEDEALCAQEGITGYPTTKINGQAYNGARTLEGIAQATGCAVPQLTGSVAASSVEATC